MGVGEGKETDRQTDRQTERQRPRQTNKITKTEKVRQREKMDEGRTVTV